jgi:hypothetical protein
MDQTIYLTVQGAISAICWLIVAGGTGLAVFARSIHDTTLERIGLSAVSITATGAAWRIAQAGWVTEGGAALALAMAGYVATVAYKHVRGEG